MFSIFWWLLFRCEEKPILSYCFVWWKSIVMWDNFFMVFWGTSFRCRLEPPECFTLEVVLVPTLEKVPPTWDLGACGAIGCPSLSSLPFEMHWLMTPRHKTQRFQSERTGKHVSGHGCRLYRFRSWPFWFRWWPHLWQKWNLCYLSLRGGCFFSWFELCQIFMVDKMWSIWFFW